MSNPFAATNPVSAADEDLTITIMPEKKELIEYGALYSAKLVSDPKKVDSSTGKPMLVSTFSLTTGQVGRQFTERTPLSVAWRVEALAEALHAPKKVDPETEAVTYVLKGTAGRSVQLKFYEDEYNGKSSPKIDKVLPPAAPAAPLSGPRIG